MEHHIQPRHVRIAHWVNAVVLLAMLWTGFAMLVADRHFAAYTHLIPSVIWNALQLTGHRLIGRAWHMGIAFLFMANAVFYAIMSLSKNTWKRIIPRRDFLRDAWTATLKEFTSPRAAMQPEDYNGAQRLTYTLVMLGGAVMIVTGLGLWLGRRAPWLLAIFGGERIALVIHIILAVSLIAFIAIHLTQVLRAGLPTLLGMITGTTAPRPQKTRRALAWGAGVFASLLLVVLALNATSDARGIPSILRWAAPTRTTISASDRLQ